MMEDNFTGTATLPQLLPLLNTSERELGKLGLEPQALVAIYNDYLTRQEELHGIARYICSILQKADKVHAVRYRIKEPLHLLKKIIRKKGEYPHRTFDSCSYLSHLNDLIGIRALYLHKDSWTEISRHIQHKWELKRLPIAYICSEGSDPFIPDFAEHGCKVITHPAGYKAVHFVIKTKPNKQRYFAEIQLRTLLEEAWSEIDHSIRYPDQDNSEFFVLLLQQLHKLTASTDKLVTQIRQLSLRLEMHRQAPETMKREIEAQLETLLNALPVREDEKQRLHACVSRVIAPDKI